MHDRAIIALPAVDAVVEPQHGGDDDRSSPNDHGEVTNDFVNRSRMLRRPDHGPLTAAVFAQEGNHLAKGWWQPVEWLSGRHRLGVGAVAVRAILEQLFFLSHAISINSSSAPNTCSTPRDSKGVIAGVRLHAFRLASANQTKPRIVQGSIVAFNRVRIASSVMNAWRRLNNRERHHVNRVRINFSQAAACVDGRLSRPRDVSKN